LLTLSTIGSESRELSKAAVRIQTREVPFLKLISSESQKRMDSPRMGGIIESSDRDWSAQGHGIVVEGTSSVDCIPILSGRHCGQIHRFFESRAEVRFQFALDSSQDPTQRFGMADHGNSNSADLQVILERTDSAHNVARYYVLSVEATLFARNTFVRRWGRIGPAGRQRLEFFDSRDSAGLALETWLVRKRQRGYMLR
jgi:predicted DNA-binding WGR domain protein